MAEALRFGLNPLPPGVEAAWGARLIVNQQGHVDVVHNRTDAVGPDERRYALLDALRDQAGERPFEELKRLLYSGELSTREVKRVTLFEDDTLIVEGNPNSSAGYCYVVAYFKADLAPVATPEPEPTSTPRCACTEKGMDPVPTDPEVDGRCRRCGDFIEYVSAGAPVPYLYNQLTGDYTHLTDLHVFVPVPADEDVGDYLARGIDEIAGQSLAHRPSVLEQLGATVKTEEGVIYTPWTDGWAVGFKATHPDGRVEYVYLNPSGGSDDDQSTVFLYQGTHGDSAQDGPVCYVDVFEPTKG